MEGLDSTGVGEVVGRALMEHTNRRVLFLCDYDEALRSTVLPLCRAVENKHTRRHAFCWKDPPSEWCSFARTPVFATRSEDAPADQDPPLQNRDGVSAR